MRKNNQPSVINHYSFGKIVIDDVTYTNDVIIYPDRLQTSWWRKDGHSLCLEDIPEILASPPEILVIGCGKSGCMKIPPAIKKDLENRGIEVIDVITDKAVEIYNNLSNEKNIVAAMHLTC